MVMNAQTQQMYNQMFTFMLMIKTMGMAFGQVRTHELTPAATEFIDKYRKKGWVEIRRMNLDDKVSLRKILWTNEREDLRWYGLILEPATGYQSKHADWCIEGRTGAQWFRFVVVEKQGKLL